MIKLIPNAVIASLALFTLSDGPVEKAAEPPVPKASGARPVTPAPAANAQKAGEPAKAAGSTKVAPVHAAPAAKPAEAKPAEAKPCEPVKPCSID
jgi:hypothetical protein